MTAASVRRVMRKAVTSIGVALIAATCLVSAHAAGSDSHHQSPVVQATKEWAHKAVTPSR
jgi:hypothetical protein